VWRDSNLRYLLCAHDNNLLYSVIFISSHMDDTLSFIVIFISLHFPRKKFLNVGPPLGLINVRKKKRFLSVGRRVTREGNQTETKDKRGCMEYEGVGGGGGCHRPG
jgi:hypothetical protein